MQTTTFHSPKNQRTSFSFAVQVLVPFVSLMACLIGPTAAVASTVPIQESPEATADDGETNSAKKSAEETTDKKPVANEAAWEFRPYKVVIWLAHDNSWRLHGVEEQLMAELASNCRQVDRSGWQVEVVRAPNPWNWRVISENFDRELYSGDLQADVLNAVGATQDADKLIIVGVKDDLGLFHTSAQEFDLRTRVWGARVMKQSDLVSLEKSIFSSVETAFMPITQIEYVHDKEVRCRVRGVGVATYAERDVNGQWQMVPNTGSPVWIGDDEILMPIVMRKDRGGNIESITPIDWTFLSIDKRDGPSLTCTTHSMRRTPLGQRSGSRVEKVALCVRAPNRETTLKLISNDKEKIALPDLEVFSRRPNQEEGTENEFIGKTDWRGQISIPPNQDPIRILLIKSGRRGLAKVPVVPGLYDSQMTSMPNDEKRLYAEGITRGLFNELMDNVARRNLIAERIKIALEKGRMDDAEDLLDELRGIPDVQEFQQRLNGERQMLLKGAAKREQDFINGYFLQLEAAASKFLNTLVEGELNKQVQDAKRF